MKRWLLGWLCRRGLHVACEHRRPEEQGRVMERLRQRRRAIDERMEATERELLRVRADLVAAEARRRRRSP